MNTTQIALVAVCVVLVLLIAFYFELISILLDLLKRKDSQ